MVDRINKCKDYYEILEISKEATKEEISKSYKKLALRLHPDKNGAPGAEDAFKKVSQAFSVLQDSSKRTQYNHRGFDAESSDAPSQYHRGYSSQGMDSMSPEELFEAFFGPGMGGGLRFSTGPMGMHMHNTRRQRTHNQNNERQQGRQNVEGGMFSTIIQLLPILLLLLFTLFGGKSEAAFSLYRDGGYTQEQSTEKYSVPYWTKGDFNRDYPARSNTLRRLEEDIEYQWYTVMTNQCKQEIAQKRKAQSYARYWGSAQDVDKAKNTRTPSCDQLRQRELYTPS